MNAAASHEAELARLLDELSTKLMRGEILDLDAEIKSHADYADELRHLIPAIRSMAQLAVGDRMEHIDSAKLNNVGDYRLIREIGRGGMGVVYEAKQLTLGRFVAVKILPMAALLDRRQLDRFKNEARAAAMLKHPNIVSVHTVGSERGVHYYAMELIEGHSLADLVRAIDQSDKHRQSGEQGSTASPTDADVTIDPTDQPTLGETPHRFRLGELGSAETQPIALFSTAHSTNKVEYARSVARLGVKIATALHYAHVEGVVHRDIKPSNILIDEMGEPQITDFGLARIEGSTELTMTGDVVGTLRYMSPEQAAGRTARIDERTDIYSLGITLYELLALTPAFPGVDRVSLLSKIEHEPPARLRTLDSGLPQDLETIINKAIAKEPSERYETAEAFADDLTRFVDQRPIKARRQSQLYSAIRWAKRNQALAASLITVGLLLTVLGIVGPFAAIQQRQQKRAPLRETYANSTLEAYRAWNSGLVSRIPDLLWTSYDDAYTTSLRGFAWHHLWNRYQSSKDERSLITEHAKLWQAGIALSLDGKKLAAFGRSGGNHRLRLFAYDGITLLKEVPSSRIHQCIFSRDGQYLFGRSDDGVRVWNAADLSEVASFSKNHRPRGISASPVDDDVAVVADGRIEIWSLSEPASPERKRTLDHPEAAVVAFSSDGQRIASGTSFGSIIIWSVNDGQQVGETIRVDSDSPLGGVAFHPLDQDLLATGTNGIDIWDSSTGKLRTRLGGRTDEVISLSFSPDGRRLVAARQRRHVQVWDIEHQELILSRVNASARGCRQALFDDDNSVLACFWNGDIRKWPIVDRPRGHTFSTGVAFVGEQSNLLAISTTEYRRGEQGLGSFHLWDLARQKAIHVGPNLRHGMPAVSPQNRNLFSVAQGQDIFVWDKSVDGEVKVLEGHGERPVGTALSPDGNFLASTSLTVLNGRPPQSLLWDLRTDPPKRIELELPSGFNALCPRFSPNSDILLLAGAPEAIHIYEVRTGRWLKALYKGGNRPLLTLGFSADKKLLATAGDRTSLRIFDWPSGALHAEIHLPDGERIVKLDFSPNRARLAVSYVRGQVGIWDIESRKQVAVFEAGNPVYGVAFSHDGKMLAAGCGNGTAVIWHEDGREEVIVPK